MFSAWMIGGNVAVVIGVLVSTLGAGFLFADDPRKSPISRAQAFVAVIFGTFVATGGGLATTYAWNLNSTAETREMLAEAEAQRLLSQRHAITGQALLEVAFNERLIDSAQFGETDLEKVRQYGVIPSLASESVTAIVTSGLFLGPQERDIHFKALALRELLRQAGAVTDQLRSAVLLTLSQRQRSSDPITAIRDAPVFQRTKEARGELVRAIAAWQAAVKPKDDATTATQPTPAP